MSFLSQLRRLPGTRSLIRRIDGAIAWRVEEQTAQISARLIIVERAAAWNENEVRRLAPQVAALEARIDDIRRRLDDAALAPATDVEAEQRTLLEEIRTEHARVRARLQAASHFEERLRRLEDGT